MRILQNPNFNFIKWRWHALALSVAVVVAGVATIVARGGLPLGVDFTGGTVIVADFVNPVDENAVRAALGTDMSDASVQRYGVAGNNEIMIRLALPPGATEEGNSLEALASQVETKLRAANLGDFSVVSRDIVGPTIGQDLRRKGVWATVTAIGAILIYIAIRFRFSFAVGAVVATFHDILITLVFLTWFGYDLSLNVIAAILTIAGYSVNDTIVIFDRVRENQKLSRRESLESIVNTAVNQTLSRTIITAGTTFLAVLSLYLFGGEVLEGFAFTMIVGIVTGTYSTVFIASAVAILLSKQPAQQASAVARQAEARRRAKGGA
jgi:preprotein translocase subunit SecF